MAEYRLDELARISGVSARNIRAYRERGLLDPPRRVGRSAYYDDYHLSQLRTINQLHRRGFNTAHIAEFFASLRKGADLADILGIQRAVLGPHDAQADEGATATDEARHTLAIDPDGDEARRLIEYGLAEQGDDGLVLTDNAVRRVVAKSPDQLVYVRAVLQIYEATREAIEGLASGFVDALDECVAARFGQDYEPRPQEMDELSRIVRDYRELWTGVVANRLDKALQEQIKAADSEYAGILLAGRRDPE